MTETRSKGGFALGDYVEVKDRIALFLAQYPDGRLLTERVELWQDDGVPRIVVKALAYRTVDDPHPGTGWSWMALPGSTSYTRGSELENTETSAWGRAIGCLGIGIGKSIASGDEVRGKAGESERKHSGLVDGDPVEETHDGEGLIGTATTSGAHDFRLRETPDGWVLPFRVKAGNRAGQIVVAHDELARALDARRDAILGRRVTVWGSYSDEESPPKADGYIVRYRVLHLSRIQTPDGILPGEAVVADPAAEVAEGSPTEYIPPEAASIPLFSDEEAAAILAAEMVEAGDLMANVNGPGHTHPTPKGWELQPKTCPQCARLARPNL